MTVSVSEKAVRLLADDLARRSLAHRPNVYLATEMRAAPMIPSWRRTIEAPPRLDRSRPVAIAFIDLMPEADYEHPVLYAFIDESSDMVHVVEANTPPNALLTEFRRIELDLPAAGPE